MKKRPSVILCILMDAIGYLTYLIPVVGEMGDFLWAPLSGFIFYKMFGGKIGMLGGLVSTIEEAVPGLDFIPTFTLGWIFANFNNAKNIEAPKG